MVGRVINSRHLINFCVSKYLYNGQKFACFPFPLSLGFVFLWFSKHLSMIPQYIREKKEQSHPLRFCAIFSRLYFNTVISELFYSSDVSLRAYKLEWGMSDARRITDVTELVILHSVVFSWFNIIIFSLFHIQNIFQWKFLRWKRIDGISEIT